MARPPPPSRGREVKLSTVRRAELFYLSTAAHEGTSTGGDHDGEAVAGPGVKPAWRSCWQVMRAAEAGRGACEYGSRRRSSRTVRANARGADRRLAASTPWKSERDVNPKSLRVGQKSCGEVARSCPCYQPRKPAAASGHLAPLEGKSLRYQIVADTLLCGNSALEKRSRVVATFPFKSICVRLALVANGAMRSMRATSADAACADRPVPLHTAPRGEVAEWLKAHAWNACRLARVSRVRIPLSPPK